jgi:hypothetical protein
MAVEYLDHHKSFERVALLFLDAVEWLKMNRSQSCDKGYACYLHERRDTREILDAG